jgi:hypothetical protein
MNKYSVLYEETIEREAVVTAKSEEEAIKKVVEVAGEHVKINGSWKLKELSVEE